MLLNPEHDGRALRARRLKIALACAFACVTTLSQAAPAMAVPTNLAPPDTPTRSGRTLFTGNGSWMLANSYSYGWYRCDAAGSGCAAVPGRTAPSYLLTTADIGRRIRSLVIATNGLGSESAVSPPTAVITAAPPVNQVPPSVSGTARIGAALSSSLGSWSDPSLFAVTYRRQWQRCSPTGFSCENIEGAGGPTHTVGPADAARFIRVIVSAEGLGVATVESPPFGPVPEPPRPGGDAGGGGTTPPTTGGLRKLRPFPVVVLAGRLVRARTLISRLIVRGPRGATVSVRCRGRGCPRGGLRTRLGSARRVRLRRFQRTYRAGAVIEIRVTGRNAIGKFTRVRIRASRPPSRRDSCLVPGAPRPSRCP